MIAYVIEVVCKSLSQDSFYVKEYSENDAVINRSKFEAVQINSIAMARQIRDVILHRCEEQGLKSAEVTIHRVKTKAKISHLKI